VSALATVGERRLTVGEWVAMIDDPTKDHRYLAAQLGGDVTAYLSWAATEARKRPRTLDSYERILARLCVLYPHLGRDEFTRDELRAWIASFPEGSRPKVWAVASDFWRWQWNEDRVRDNPMRGIRRPPPNPRKVIDVFTSTERGRLIQAQAGSLMPVVDKCRLLIVQDGLRKTEARLLRVDDVNVVDRYLIVRNAKGGDERIVPFGDELQRAFMDFLYTPLPRLGREPEPDDMVWFASGATGHYGDRQPQVTWVDAKRAMSSTAFHRWWQRVIGRAGVTYRKPHTARHTYATDLLDATGDITHVQQALGHKSLATTEMYVHNQRQRLRRAVEQLEQARKVRVED
jgi:integrase/recombinase XerC